MGIGLTIQQYLPSPTSNGAVTTPAGASGAVAGNYSIAIAACFHPLGLETDLDYIAVDRSTRGGGHPWDNIPVGTDDNVAASFASPAIGEASRPYYPHHYMLLIQSAAAFNFANASALIARSTTGIETSITATSATSIASFTFGTAAPSIVFKHFFRVEPVYRNDIGSLYDGYPARMSTLNACETETLRMVFPGSCMLHSEANRLLKWRRRIIALAVETEYADAEMDAPAQSHEGIFVDANFMNSEGKDDNPQFSMTFKTHRTYPSAYIPIGDPTP